MKEEKQLLRDIKNLKACREEVCANAALHAEFAESLGERDEVQQRLSVSKSTEFYCIFWTRSSQLLSMWKCSRHDHTSADAPSLTSKAFVAALDC